MKKIKLLFFALILLGLSFALFSSNTIKATTLETSNQFSVIGAQVRTTGNPGIRFVGSIGTYNNSNVTKYGLALAFGEAEASDVFHKDATINDKKVISVEVDSVNASGNFFPIFNWSFILSKEITLASTAIPIPRSIAAIPGRVNTPSIK